jgi:hypothetical protein
VDAQTVSFFFAAGTVAPGNIWEIAAAPSGLDFHGATFAVPQGGVVE